MIQPTPTRAGLLQVIDQMRHDGGAEAIVDVDDDDARRAGVEHAKQRGEAYDAKNVARGWTPPGSRNFLTDAN